jgi:hypothetical protein
MEIDLDKYSPSEEKLYTNRVKVELVHQFH